MDKKKRPKNPDEVQLTLRLPRTLHGRLGTSARQERRSLHAQILHELETAGACHARPAAAVPPAPAPEQEVPA